MPIYISSSNRFQELKTNSHKFEESSSTLPSKIKSMTTATNVNPTRNEKHDHISYKEYKAAGEYWNKYPKTDYTYSHMSPHRREVVPGIVAMPNMSRKSLQTATTTSLQDDISKTISMGKYNQSGSFDLNNQRKYTTWSKNYSEIQIDQYSHSHEISYNNTIQKFLEFFSMMGVLFPNKNIRGSYEKDIGKISFESTKAELIIQSNIGKTSFESKKELIIQLPLRSSILRGLRTLYMLISFCLYIDALCLRSIKLNSYVKRRLGIIVLILLPCLTSIVVRSTENDNFSSSRAQSLITFFYGNIRKNEFFVHTNTPLTKTLNCFWKQLQSSKLYCGRKLEKEISECVNDKSNNKQIKYLHRVIKVNRKLNGDIFTKSYPSIKLCITDLSQITVLLITTKNINLLEREYVDKPKNSTNANTFLVQNTSNSVHEGYTVTELNTFSDQNDSPKNAKLKYGGNTNKDRSLIITYKNIFHTLFSTIWERIYVNEPYTDQAKMANVITYENEVSPFTTRRKLYPKYEESLLEITPLLFSLLRRNLASKFKIDILKLKRLHKENSYLITEEKIRSIVHEAIEIYDADKTGRVDYALESAGGQVLSTRCTEMYSTKTSRISVFGISIWTSINSPRTAIKPSVFPGECWAFQGFPGSLVLKLNALIYVTGFTIEHIRKNLTPYGCIDSAPKNFTVWGLLNEDDQDPMLFGKYQFLDNGVAIQYFPVKKKSNRKYDITELKIESNHGNELYTCLYRFRVHGTPFHSEN